MIISPPLILLLYYPKGTSSLIKFYPCYLRYILLVSNITKFILKLPYLHVSFHHMVFSYLWAQSKYSNWKCLVPT